MNEVAPDTLTVLPDPRMFRAARWSARVCLGIAGIAVLFGLAPLLRTGSGTSSLATTRGGLPLIITGLLCAVSLFASEPERDGKAIGYVRWSANGMALFAAAVVVFWMRVGSSGLRSGIAFPAARIGFGFVLLTIAMILVETRGWFVNRVVDTLTCGLGLLLLVIVSDLAFEVLDRSAAKVVAQTSMPVLVCLAALICALTLRQAEHGVFSILLGAGAGSRLARIFAPILLALPFALAAVIAGMNHGAPVGHLGSAALASAAVMSGLSMLLFFAWRMSGMENEIHDLVLRDEATRLYNHRGFHMLAEHALRLAERSSVPFSVLFIHMENLAHIHAELGSEGSNAALAEAGEILRATFRESDIKGRIGADEFAVAGQFDRAGISIAAMRLEAATAARMTKRRGPVPLKLSMGHVTTSEVIAIESLKEMLTRAGQMRHQQTAQLRQMPVN